MQRCQIVFLKKSKINGIRSEIKIVKRHKTVYLQNKKLHKMKLRNMKLALLLNLITIVLLISAKKSDDKNKPDWAKKSKPGKSSHNQIFLKHLFLQTLQITMTWILKDYWINGKKMKNL